MAITEIITATQAAVDPAAGNQFTTTGPFTLYADDLGYNEHVTLWRLGPTGYREATNKEGKITLSALPNMVYVEIPGTFRLEKPATALEVAVGYEEV